MNKKMLMMVLALASMSGILLFQNFSSVTAPAQSPTLADRCARNNQFDLKMQLETKLATQSGAMSQERCWDDNQVFNSSTGMGSKEHPRFEVVTQGLPPIGSSAAAAANYGYVPQTIGFGQVYAAPANYISFKRNSDSTTIPALKKTANGVKKFAMMWGNRCSPVMNSAIPKSGGDPNGCSPNPYSADMSDFKASRFFVNNTPDVSSDSQEYDFFFTTYAKADACTEAQTLATIGESQDKILNILNAAHLGLALHGQSPDLLRAARALATQDQRKQFFGDDRLGHPNYKDYQAPTSLNTGTWVADVCFVPTMPANRQGEGAGPMADTHEYVAGLFFDWETSDFRSGNLTAAFFTRLAAEVRAHDSAIKMIMVNDPLAGYGKYAGLDASSGPALLRALDAVEVFVYQAGSGGSYCTDDSVETQIRKQMKLWGVNVDDPNLSPNIYAKFMVGYSLGGGINQARELRNYMANKSFVYIQPQNPFVRQYSCDVSDAYNGGDQTHIARQMMDLFNLPVPSLTNLNSPDLNIKAADKKVALGGETQITWFVQNATSPTGRNQVQNCRVTGPGGQISTQIMGTQSTGPLQQSGEYTLSCEDLVNQRTVSASAVVVVPFVVDLMDMSLWRPHDVQLSNAGQALALVENSGTSESVHRIQREVVLPVGSSTNDTFTLVVVAESIGKGVHQRDLRLHVSDPVDSRNDFGLMTCALGSGVDANERTGTSASHLAVEHVSAGGGKYRCLLTVQPNKIRSAAGAKLRLTVAFQNPRATKPVRYQGDGVDGVKIHSIELTKP